jgi:hypothetical protein
VADFQGQTLHTQTEREAMIQINPDTGEITQVVSAPHSLVVGGSSEDRPLLDRFMGQTLYNLEPESEEVEPVVRLERLGTIASVVDQFARGGPASPGTREVPTLQSVQ